MSYIKTALTLLISLFWLISHGQNFQHLGANQHLDGGQFYFLPKAGFQIELLTVIKDIKAGESLQKDYTDDELKILSKKYGVDPKIYKKVISGDFKTYEIAEDSIKMTQVRLNDLSKAFINYPKRKWNANQSGALTYSEDGMITDAELKYEDRTFDIAIKGLAGLASIATGLRGIAKFNASKVTIDELDKVLSSYAKLDVQNNFDVYKDLKATYDKQYAKVFAEHFYSIKSKTKAAKLIYCPSLTMAYGTAQEVDIFELDNAGNLYFNNAIKSNIVWFKTFREASGTLSKPYKLKFNLLAKDYQIMEKYSGSSAPSNSYVGYNVPAKTLVSIITPDKEELGLDVYKVPQFGKVGYVSAKKMNVVFQLDPITGELKKLSIDRKAITDDQVGNTATAITSAISAVKGDDEDTKLDKEVKRLENNKKKRDLLKDLQVQD
jgi:hypothetical protein